MAGCRGVVFQSNSPLNAPTNAARRRALALELFNRHLQFIEPWMASGKIVGQISSNKPSWAAALFYADGARLLVPFEISSEIANATKNPAAELHRPELSFTVSGVPESSRAFFASPVSFRQLNLSRVAGGTRIVMPAGEGGMILITEDPKIIQAIRQRVVRDAARNARLEFQLAELRLKSITDLQEQSRAFDDVNDGHSSHRTAWATELRTCNDLLAANQIEAAHNRIAALTAELLVVMEQQRNHLSSEHALVSNPLALSHEQLQAYAEFSQSTSRLRSGANLLYGGDFEDLAQIVQFGWRNLTHLLPEIEAGARLSAREPRQGGHCLELFASSKTNGAIANIETPPVWIVSHPIPVEPGDTIEIRGWVRIDEPIKGSADGVQIVDTLGGPELAISVHKTSGWQEFHMIRAVPQPTELRITFALTGLGAARIDGVMVHILKPPAVRRLPETEAAVSGKESAEFSELGPSLTAPISK
jgi:hypothetical protein